MKERYHYGVPDRNGTFMENRQFRLIARPVGMVKRRDFEFIYR
jgi:hypothetical protein